MKRVPVRSALVAVAMLTVMVISVAASSQAYPASQVTGSIRWLTYVDPRFDFSIRYPSNWQVIPRDDSDPDAVSGILVFVPIAAPDDNVAASDPHELGPHVIVVPYMAELKDGQSLSEWTEMYESLGHESDRAAIQRQPRKVFRVSGAPAVNEEGVSPLTTYQFTNLAHENMVWDIWTNVAGTDPYAPVYNRMVRSFRFGRNSPTNLREAYGSDFVPMDMEEALTLSLDNHVIEPLGPIDDEGQSGRAATKTGLTSTWKSPVWNTTSGPRTITCGSTKHKDAVPPAPPNSYSAYAADILVPEGTVVTNSKVGTVTFVGYKNDGYGNLVTIKASGGKEAYYAHLKSIYTALHVGNTHQTYGWIGASGNTGTVQFHLHFHVRWGNDSVDLKGMEGFTAYANWPGTPNGISVTCGTMGR